MTFLTPAYRFLCESWAASELLAEEDSDTELLPDDEAISILDGDPSEPVPLASGHETSEDQGADDSQPDKGLFDSSGVDLSDLREAGEKD